MTKVFALIEPAKKLVRMAPFDALKPALNDVNLDKGLDFGSIAPEHSIVVYEFGFFEKPEDQHFFAIGRNLYAGNAVVFREVGDKFEDISPEVYNSLLQEVRFFNSYKDVEDAIELEEVIQPSLKVGGEVVWTWPQPRPDVFVG